MKKILALLFLLSASRARAQAPITEAELTPDVVASLVAFYNSAETSRITGDYSIAAGNEVGGNLALLEGSLTLAGHVRGDLLVINGSVVFDKGAVVDGTVTVVGGLIRGAEHLQATSVMWYRDRMRYDLADGRIVARPETDEEGLHAGYQFGFVRADMMVAARGGYNRSEGLPIHIGPRFTAGRSNPTVLQAEYIFRTAASFRFDDKDYGFLVRGEQYLGGHRAFRVGARYADEVLPIEMWGLTDRENSIASLVLHRDYRDHYNRKGWAAFFAGGRGGLPFNWEVKFGDYRFENAALRDPYSIMHNADPWRPEVEIEPRRLHVLSAEAGYDTRNETRDPSTGWFISGLAERTSLYKFGQVDVRRYIRFSPVARLSLRATAAGSLDNETLPAFRQQALGGEGSMPGFDQYRFDCGAHGTTVNGRFPYHGCNKLTLFQAEYQSNFWWLSRLGRKVGRDFGLLNNIRWVVFYDAGKAGDYGADAGFGLRFNQLGAYWSVPLSTEEHRVNFFMRLGPRI